MSAPAVAPASGQAPALKRVLTLTDVALFNIVVVFSLRGMATAAKMGPLSVLLWLLATAAFFVPLALTITELASRDPGEGGFYRWVRAGFGDAHGFLAAWFYWLSNLTYLPSLLIFLAGNVPFVWGDLALGENKWFVMSLALGVLWISTWLNVRGLSLGRLVTNFGATANWVAALLLIAAGVAAYLRFGPATPLSAGAFTAAPDALRTLGYFGTLSFALVGIELATLMGEEIKDPRRTIPRAIALSGVLIAALYVLGTLAILVAVPPAEVSPISGALGAVQAVADRAGWGFLPGLTATLVTFAVFAGFTGWLGGMARLPYAVGLDRFLPPVLSRLHPRHGTPHVAVLLQAALTSVFIVASQAGATVRAAYLTLLYMTIVLNFAPFLYIFLALPRLRPDSDEPEVVRVPGGRRMLWVVALAGFGATLLTLASAAVPTPDAGSAWQFEAKVWGGVVVFGLAGWGIFRSRTHRRTDGPTDRRTESERKAGRGG